MAPLSEHIHKTVLQTLESIGADERDDIYVVSFFVCDEEDDPRKPTVTVGFNSETDVANATAPDGSWSTFEQEARWNYAYWRQNRLATVCDSNADPLGADLREEWARENGLWYDLAENEDPVFNERGEALTSAFVSLLVEVVRQLHADGDIQRLFGRTIPVLVHELEYYDEIGTQNLEANPPGAVPEDFIAWGQG